MILIGNFFASCRSCFQARNLEHHVEVVITEFAEGDVDQLPVGVQVVHDCFRLSNLGSFLLFENYIDYIQQDN